MRGTQTGRCETACGDVDLKGRLGYNWWNLLLTQIVYPEIYSKSSFFFQGSRS